MAPDDVLKACGDKGGIIGIEAAPHTTITKAHPRHNLEAYMEHFEYIKDLVGIDHVGFGPDTLYAITSACTTRTSRAFRSKRLAIKTTSASTMSKVSRTRRKRPRTSSAGS